MIESVYIHIPFCKTICSYCDFCKVFYNKNWTKKYLSALKKEIIDRYNKETIKTIYFGGGSPSSLSLEELDILLSYIYLFNLDYNPEITFECNLNDINKDLLKILKNYNVNRLSIGIQSFNEDNLLILGREHTYKEAKEKIALLRSMGFNNINLDLMYGIKGQTIKSLKEDLKLFKKLKPEHISTYSLILNDHTILSVNKEENISDDLDYQMYKTVCKSLKKYNHYEISNFALKGYECKHNLTYWNNEHYYGFGLSASGYIDSIRYTNTYNLRKYLNNNYQGNEELISNKTNMDNEIMLGLRKIKGINEKQFFDKFKCNIKDEYPIMPLLKNKDLIEKDGYIFIPLDKIYIQNEILLKMI